MKERKTSQEFDKKAGKKYGKQVKETRTANWLGETPIALMFFTSISFRVFRRTNFRHENFSRCPSAAVKYKLELCNTFRITIIKRKFKLPRYRFAALSSTKLMEIELTKHRIASRKMQVSFEFNQPLSR